MEQLKGNQRSFKLSRKAFLFACVILAAVGLHFVRAAAEESQKSTQLVEFLSVYTTDFEQVNEPVFPEYITIAGTDISGMTLEEVTDWIETYVNDRQKRHVTFVVLGNNFEYEMTDFGINWENPDDVSGLEQYLLSGNFVEQYKAQKDLQANPLSIAITFSIDENKLESTVADYIANFQSTPKNATVVLTDAGFQVVEGSIGHSFDQAAITSQLREQMTDYSTSETLVYDFPHQDTEPAYYSNVFNFEFTILGEYTTHTLGTGERLENIKKSAAGINGKVVYPGEQFTALTWYGPVTEENGYYNAPTYQDGQQLPGIGGGICQTTTTLYCAILYAELGVYYRSPHSMMVAYVPPSMDAMVDYNTGADFIGYNNQESPVYFQAYVNGDSLTVRIWGKETRPANRTVSYDSNIQQIEFPDPLYEVIAVNDEVCKRGAYYVGEKTYEEVAPHPRLVSQLIKRVRIDGELVSETIVNPEKYNADGVGYDDYDPMSGRLYYASDCIVNVSLIDDPTAWYGKRIHLDVRFPNGNEWNEYAYEENMGG